MAIPRELLAQVRRLDEYELRRLLIVVRGLLTHTDGQPSAEEPDLPAGLTYRREPVRCGKAGCTTCPHGPYWYAYWKEDGRTRKRYVGHHLPGEAGDDDANGHDGAADGAAADVADTGRDRTSD